MEKQKKMDSSTNHEQQQATSEIGDLTCDIECDLGCELVRDIESLDASTNIERNDSLGEPFSCEFSVLSSQDLFDDKKNDEDDDYVELDHMKDIATLEEDRIRDITTSKDDTTTIQLDQDHSTNEELCQVG